MHHLAVNTVIEMLIPTLGPSADEMTEAEYFTACSETLANSNRPTLGQRLRAVGRFLWPTRLAAMLAAAEARRKDKAGMAILLRGDPWLLRDLGVDSSPFGAFILAGDADQSEDLPTAAPTPVVRVAPRFARHSVAHAV